MAAGTNVPIPTFSSTGFIAPLESAVLAGVQADMQAAFGGVLNFTTNSGAATNATANAQLSNSWAAVLGFNNDLFLLFTNLVDPALTYGRYQDAIGRIYFITRIPATASLFTGSCVGAANVDIPSGTPVTDQSGNVWVSTADGNFGPNGGTILVPFSCLQLGPTAVPTSITSFQAIGGWDAISVVGGTVGNIQESSQQFEVRRSLSTGWQSTGPLGAMLGAVLSVPGVIDAYVTDNSTGASLTVGGLSLPCPCVYICVLGGTAQAVAQAIWSRKIPGCPYFPSGNTTVTVQDTSPVYVPPLPTYTVIFNTAIPVQFAVAVEIIGSSLVPANAVQLIQQTIVSAFAGQAQIGYNTNGLPIYTNRARIGQEFLASSLVPAIQFLGPWARIGSIGVVNTNSPDAMFTGSIATNVLTVSAIASGVVLVGGFVFDPAGLVASGTQILSQNSGPSGGVGQYAISISQTVASEVMSSASADNSEAQVNINQAPSISPANISVVFGT